MKEKIENKMDEIKKEIVIERLRQAPAKINISFGSSKEFMNRDELIEQVEKETEIGKKIIKIQLEYLRAFKQGVMSGG